jgi:5'-3' exonuclease
VQVHLVDGTYELYRQHFGQARGGRTRPNAATIGVLSSTVQLLEDGATHVGVATDTVIESFRNDLYAGYKTSEGMEPEILAQIPLVELALRAIGVTVWAAIEYEADDMLASAVRVACEDRTVHQVSIVSPDKDLAQCVRGRRVVQFDRRKGLVVDEDGVVEKFGVPPTSIPDWLALVGDSSDGYPGVAGWGAKSASAVLARYGRLEAIPRDADVWRADGLFVRGAERLVASLSASEDEAVLFKDLATLRDDAEVGDVADWRWVGATDEADEVLEELEASSLLERIRRLR